MEILFHRALSEAQFPGDLFVGLRLADQRDDLAFAKRKRSRFGLGLDLGLGLTTGWTAVLFAYCLETPAAARATAGT